MRRSNPSNSGISPVRLLALAFVGTACADPWAWDCDGADTVGWLDDADDLERFRGVRRICGDLQITGEIDSLEALAALEVVEGSLLIDRSALTSTEPLANLRQVEGHLGFTNNPVLERIDLPRFESAGGELGIVDNPELQAVDLPEVTSLNGTLFIASNPRLEAITPMPSLSEALSIYVAGNLLLSEYRIPAGLTSTADILVAENPALLVIEGGDSLTTVDAITIFANEQLEIIDLRVPGHVESLGIAANPSLVGLSGLGEIDAVDTLIIKDNDSLSTVPGLAGVDVMAIVYIGENDSLVDIESYSSLQTLDRLTVIHNPMLPSNRVAAAFADVVVVHRKVDGNSDQPVPHVADCPWANDGECDEAQTAGGMMGTGLCLIDPADCGTSAP